MEKTTAAKAETPKVELPRMELPKLALPKLDFDALVALQKANIETMLAAHKIVFDLAQTVAKRQAELMKELIAIRHEVRRRSDFPA